MPFTHFDVMTRKLLLSIGFAAATLISSAQTKKAQTTGQNTLPRPKLVVGIVVDQMRWDYLYRYFDRYQAGGFKRMLNEGFTCENTLIPYIPTVTAAGHTCIYTGSVPSIHGIAGNDFIVQATGKSMYCTDDSTVVAVGSTSKAGKMSPRNMLTSTVTDELRFATNFRSKVIGIALKDRGGILPAGHAASAAYWFDDANGSWISSTYYMTDLPAWVKNFNAGKPAEKYLNQDWNTLYPINTYVQSEPDNTPGHEGKFSGTEAPTFPIKTSAIYKGNAGLIRSTPYGNSMTLDLARAAVDSENLGKNVVTDFLAVSLSSTDYVGHQFGPNSVEAEDTYLRLDKDLAAFFTYLDGKVGKGNYTVFLTADHGAAHNANFLIDHKVPAGVWNDGPALTGLNKMLEDKYSVKRAVLSFNNYQVNLNNTELRKQKVSDAAIKLDVIQYLMEQPAIAYAVDMQRVEEANIPAALKERIQNGYSPEHSGTIQIVLKPGWYSGHGQTGTTHGTWNPYDAHIPLVFMGWGVKHGSLTRETHMTDIAPTVAQLLHIQAPNGNVGTAIGEVLK